MAMFDKYKVLSPRELHSRYEVYLEQYVLSVHRRGRRDRKGREDRDPAGGAALPGAARRQRRQADRGGHPADRTMLDAVTSEITKLTAGIAALESALAHERARCPRWSTRPRRRTS